MFNLKQITGKASIVELNMHHLIFYITESVLGINIMPNTALSSNQTNESGKGIISQSRLCAALQCAD